MKHLYRAFTTVGAIAFATAYLSGSVHSSAGLQEQTLAQPSSGDWFLNLERPGRSVAMAIPDFEILTSDATESGKTISEVVWNDMDFASVYRLVPKRNYSIAQGSSDPRKPDFYQWESIGADILVRGVVEAREGRLISEVRIYAILAQEMVFGKRYEGPLTASRRMAHRIADDILLQAGNYRGVNQTKLAFASDRRGENSKEIYIMDYDGFAQKPITANRSLNLTPTWSPDGQALAYISYRTGTPSLFRAFLYEGRGDNIAAGDGMTFSPAWSPDGKHIAFTSTRDGNSEIYIANADGGDVRRLTDHPSIDTAPCWSPTGTEIAFTSDRTGTPQIYAMDREGLNLRRISYQGSYNDGPSWSPSREYSEIAFASRIERGPFDIVVYDFQTNQVRQLTTGRGSNESPEWSPNGLHLVFTSTRTGSSQVFTMNRDGSNLRQLTRDGNNTTPNWGPIAGQDS
ncbi:MAG TPA: Tol-Pal system beta propeller repeat protein TolB [Vicinamibacteria bacterium]|nr:Tol-Pal system beta propeller repeat protein TolB [Vicinamibacteria bacterium]